MTTRTPATSRYDALVDFHRTDESVPTSAYGLVKLTYDIEAGACVLAPAEPLFHDLRDPELEPRMCPGSDYWPHKAATDVVVTGSAWHPGGVARPQRSVSITVGAHTKTLRVTGTRFVDGLRGGLPCFTAPEVFEEMPLANACAYGGWDARVPMPRSRALADVLARQYEHPGIYPRNPFGKGYVVVPELPENEVELPNLEDPSDLLTPERFFVRDPRAWYRQPLPWNLDWTGPAMFHRFAWLGQDGWFPSPDDEHMPEVRRGFLPPRYRDLVPKFEDTSIAPAPFFQEASLGMVFRELTPGTPITLVGMHPEHEVMRIRLPAPPKIAFSIGTPWEPAQPRVHSVQLLPGRQKLQILFGATYSPLPRRYAPGVHVEIPLAMRVGDDAPIMYETPASIADPRG